MSEVRYQIGQKAWRATWDSSDAWVTCPDCGGTGRIRCLLHDDTMVSIECEGCKRGYNPPTGLILVYDRRARAESVIVSGFSVEGSEVEYRVTNGQYTYHVNASHIFDTEDGALEKASEMVAQHDREERDRISRKEKPTKSWSWHVHYHRRCIRDAQKQIDYHTSKLNVARVKAKEPADAT